MRTAVFLFFAALATSADTATLRVTGNLDTSPAVVTVAWSGIGTSRLNFRLHNCCADAPSLHDEIGFFCPPWSLLPATARSVAKAHNWQTGSGELSVRLLNMVCHVFGSINTYRVLLVLCVVCLCSVFTAKLVTCVLAT